MPFLAAVLEFRQYLADSGDVADRYQGDRQRTQRARASLRLSGGGARGGYSLLILAEAYMTPCLFFVNQKVCCIGEMERAQYLQRFAIITGIVQTQCARDCNHRRGGQRLSTLAARDGLLMPPERRVKQRQPVV